MIVFTFLWWSILWVGRRREWGRWGGEGGKGEGWLPPLEPLGRLAPAKRVLVVFIQTSNPIDRFECFFMWSSNSPRWYRMVQGGGALRTLMARPWWPTLVLRWGIGLRKLSESKTFWLVGHFLQKPQPDDLSHFLELGHQNHDKKHWVGGGPFLNLGPPERQCAAFTHLHMQKQTHPSAQLPLHHQARNAEKIISASSSWYETCAEDLGKLQTYDSPCVVMCKIGCVYRRLFGKKSESYNCSFFLSQGFHLWRWICVTSSFCGYCLHLE